MLPFQAQDWQPFIHYTFYVKWFLQELTESTQTCIKFFPSPLLFLLNSIVFLEDQEV